MDDNGGDGRGGKFLFFVGLFNRVGWDLGRYNSNDKDVTFTVVFRFTLPGSRKDEIPGVPLMDPTSFK